MRVLHLIDGRMVVANVETPVAAKDEAVVQVTRAGICGTDLALLDGYANFSGVPGQEFVGTVTSGPPAWLGKRVVANINIGYYERTIHLWRGVMKIVRSSAALLTFTLAFFSSYSLATIVSATLPSSRAVQVDATATAFGTIINAGTETAIGCGLNLGTVIDASFTYQTTDPATNLTTGTANTPIDVAPGASQSFVFAITPNSEFESVDVAISFDCENTDPASSITGLNTLLLTAATDPIPDLVALAAANLGIVDVPDDSNIGVFSVATVNLGASGTVDVTADVAGADLPIGFLLCQTDPLTSACINPVVASSEPVSVTIGGGETPTFAVFVTATGEIPFDPGNHRVFLRLKDAIGNTRGSTSVAVRSVVVDSAIAMSGEVTTFPDEESEASPYAKTAGDDSTDENVTQDELTPTPAIISLYLLSDLERTDPIATIKTRADGTYDVRASDVEAWLIANGHTAAGATDDAILSALQGLGQLQVNALIVSINAAGERKALAFQTIADPSSAETIRVNPIIHQIVKKVLDKVSDAVDDLRELGLSDESIASLKKTVLADVAAEIFAVLAEADGTTLEIPEGQTARDVIDSIEDDFEVDLTEEELIDLEETIEREEELTAVETRELRDDNILNADEIKQESDASDSLDSESEGLLAKLERNLSDTLTEEVDDLGDEGFTSADAASAADEKTGNIRRESLQKFFLAMGFSVVVAEDPTTGTHAIVTSMQTPSHIPDGLLPGKRAFGQRNLRYFRIGEGTLGGLFADARTIDEEVADKLAGLDQSTIDAILDNPARGQSDFEKLDRLRLFHELLRRVEENPLVSRQLQEFVLKNVNTRVRIKQLAAVVADNFEWVQEIVNLSSEGLPIYTDRHIPVGQGSAVEASQIARILGLRLAEDPGTAVRTIAEGTAFYAQFASESIEVKLQAKLAAGIDLPLRDILLDIYPETDAGYRDLIIGNPAENLFPSPPYKRARDRLARGITASFTQDEFGTTLTGETELNIRSSIFLVNLLLNSKFLIEHEEGYFIPHDFDGAVRSVPHFGNLKMLEGTANDMSLAGFVTELLDSSDIEESDAFHESRERISHLMSALPSLPEFEEFAIEDFEEHMGTAADLVSASCAVERFDDKNPLDPFADGNEAEALTVSIHSVEFNERTGDFFKSDEPVAMAVGELLTRDDGHVVVNFVVENLATVDGDRRGLEYVMRFNIPSYEHEVPELFFWVDGFVDQLTLCDPEHPWHIGPDEAFASIPGIGLQADQVRHAPDGTLQPEAVDLSNFEKPGGLVFLTEDEVARGEGVQDFHLASTPAGFSLEIVGDEGGFLPLYGNFDEDGVHVSLDPADREPLFGIFSLIGSNVRDSLNAIGDGALTLAPAIALESDPDLFEYDRLYLYRDSEGAFWILELRFLDIFEDFDGTTSAFVDIGFASVNQSGVVDLPEVAFDAGPRHADGNDQRFNILHFGDYLILEPPSGYEGSDLLAPAIFTFADNDTDYDLVDLAADGLVLRYAGDYFDDNIDSPDDFDARFAGGNFRDVPVRLDASSPMVKVSFDHEDKRYIMSPNPDEAINSVSSLVHGDIVIVLREGTDDDREPAYLMRVQRLMPDEDPSANQVIALEIVPFTDGVACMNEGRTSTSLLCPPELPEFFIAPELDVAAGVIVDHDFDGVPAVFDPNDGDPNIPGRHLPSTQGHQPGLAVRPIIEDEDGTPVRRFLFETRDLSTPDIKAVSLRMPAIFGNEDLNPVIECGRVRTVTDLSGDLFCEAVTGYPNGLTVNIDNVSFDFVTFILGVPDAVLDDLGERTFLDYSISFRDPVDADGRPLTCGDQPCEALPQIEDTAVVRIIDIDSLRSIGEVTLAQANQAPYALDTISSIDVTRPLHIAAAPVAGAMDYELALFCAAVDATDAFTPDHYESYYAPGRDANGRPIPVDFELNIPYLGGRTCQLELVAFLFNDAGEFVGENRIVFEDIVTTGGSDEFFDNGLKVGIGDQVCIVGGDIVTAPLGTSGSACNDDNRLFLLEGTSIDDTTALILDDGPGGHHALLRLGLNVQRAKVERFAPELVHGLIADGSVIAIDDLADPNCGFISNGADSGAVGGTICSIGGQAQPSLTEILVRDGNVLMPLAQLIIDGPVTSSGHVNLEEGGFYQVVRPDGHLVAELVVDLLDDGGVFVTLHGPHGGVVFERTVGDDPLIRVKSPAFILIDWQDPATGDTQGIDFDLRRVSEAGARFQFFVEPTTTALVGEHDLDGDGNVDVTVAKSLVISGAFTFEFREGAAVTRFDPSTGMQESLMPDADTGLTTSTFLLQNDETTSSEYFIEFEVRLTSNADILDLISGDVAFIFGTEGDLGNEPRAFVFPFQHHDGSNEPPPGVEVPLVDATGNGSHDLDGDGVPDVSVQCCFPDGVFIVLEFAAGLEVTVFNPGSATVEPLSSLDTNSGMSVSSNSYGMTIVQISRDKPAVEFYIRGEHIDHRFAVFDLAGDHPVAHISELSPNQVY